MALLAALQSIFANLAPFHLLSFSALFGSQLYQTFVVTKVAFTTLPRPAYIKFQKTIFPVYFHGQSLLLLLTAATVPPLGPLSLVQQKGDWIPFAVSGAAAGLNFVVYGPRTRQLMLDRAQQGTVDAKVTGLDGPSEEMALLKRKFSRAHAMCIHLNLISIGALVWYTWRLASHLQY
ncbi:hypothetical protein EDB81DRAFT_90345 [Dactylonectria macrodidyma]|uniref:TMEM205-like domain-containing protein n=1 Tax=Dactylonectria macrodidyma TaxID=307937 RepID=A0A9P9E9X2_9HYPO|nr:hypothetical protein EDB81DRAFT_90345 [Dactylonectria macrodidyma]